MDELVCSNEYKGHQILLPSLARQLLTRKLSIKDLHDNCLICYDVMEGYSACQKIRDAGDVAAELILRNDCLSQYYNGTNNCCRQNHPELEADFWCRASELIDTAKTSANNILRDLNLQADRLRTFDCPLFLEEVLCPSPRRSKSHPFAPLDCLGRSWLLRYLDAGGDPTREDLLEYLENEGGN